MNCDVTLTKEEFKVLHNSLCDLDRFCQFKEIEEIVARIRGVALKSAYAQDEAAFDRQHTYFESFREANGLRARWSIYELDAHGFLCPHPFEGATHVLYDNHWGQGDPQVEIDGRTWADLYRAADKVITKSGDMHHCFIESFTPIRDKPGHLRLTTGS